MNVADALALKLKIMARLNIAEKRIPQDGRFSIKIRGKNFDVRLSTLPTQFGESIVLRLLNQSMEVLKLHQLGIPEGMLQRLQKIISLPNGLLLMTGPTGSGKTTTLYAILSELNTPNTKIITVEDPVEYRLPRINQVQVQPKIDLTFARVLRAILRQDPDIILVGELRDRETAEIAVRAAMTGHFVFATVHTNDAVSTVVRLCDMGVENYLIATVLRAVISQRLVRRICQNCIEDYTATLQEKSWLTSIERIGIPNLSLKYGKGCTYCHQTGYKGQIAVFELLELNDVLASALRGDDTNEFVSLVQKDTNFKPILLSGMEFVSQGITTVSEIMRITGEIFSETAKESVAGQ
jgi:MSHA biogenesis protein MshE